MDLKPFTVTVVRFDPATGPATGETFHLPVDSPDEEHAISAAMSNAVAFTPKFLGAQPTGSGVKSIAFLCTGVAPRQL